MNILFIHRSFPGQFKYLATFLSLDKNNKVMFITEDEANHLEGVNKVLYEPIKPSERTSNPNLNVFDFAVLQALRVAQKAQELKEKGFIPDVIYGFSGWGTSMFIKDVFPKVPFICYCEWYLNADGGKMNFGDTEVTFQDRLQARCNNSHILTTLSGCDYAIAPTQWQKEQFPEEFQSKIRVIPDIFDTGVLIPDKNVEFEIPSKGLKFTRKDEIITYGTRGLEPTRGFPQFMEAVEKLLKTRPNAHFLIAGDDKAYYSPKLEKTYKQLMLEKLDIDENRVHFVDTLPFNEYRKFLQVSSAHIYLTSPFVLSWSIIEAMSCGACVISSTTPPVLEIIKDGYNGLLTEFFDVDKLCERINYALDNPEIAVKIGVNARNSVIEKFDLLKVLPQHLNLVNESLNKL
jgi:glycosyltransferase involved in cell wall biosynthesis